MKILVLPKATVVESAASIVARKIPVISILDSDVREPIFDPLIEHSLTVAFDDITPKALHVWTTADDRPLKCMDPDQAESIIKFIMEWKTDDLFIIHCSAGICRSGAVATFMESVLKSNPVEDLIKDNPHIQPNVWVENMLFYKFGEMGFETI